MASNADAIFAGGPDRVAGAIKSAVRGTVLPTDVATAAVAAFVDCGYISEDGVTVTQDESWSDITEWGGLKVKRIQSDYDVTLKFTFLETNIETTKAFFGDSNVTSTAATVSSGTKLAIKFNGEESPHKSWVFNIKDGLKKVRIVVPDGVITSRGDLSYTRSGVVMYEVTLSTTPDEDGNAAYKYTDDGVFSGV